jgi:hypothetical protein
MPRLIISQKREGQPTAWKCSECPETFTVPPNAKSNRDRIKAITTGFREHMRTEHAGKKDDVTDALQMLNESQDGGETV